MTNFEYWKDKILKINNEDGDIAIIKGIPSRCCSAKKCYYCDLSLKGNSCRQQLIEWLYSEHEEEPKLTKRERKLCEALETGWIAANKSGKVYWYNRLPIKGDNAYVNCGKSMYISGAGFFFAFINFEDEEPWMVENLLQLEVM